MKTNKINPRVWVKEPKLKEQAVERYIVGWLRHTTSDGKRTGNGGGVRQSTGSQLIQFI